MIIDQTFKGKVIIGVGGWHKNGGVSNNPAHYDLYVNLKLTSLFIQLNFYGTASLNAID